MKELTASLDVIRKASAELIDAIDKQYNALAKERGIDLSVVADELGAEQNLNMIDGVINNEPPKSDEAPAEPSANMVEPDILAVYARNAQVRNPRQEGLTILMPLLYEDGNLNRDNKRSRVKVEPLIGKYEIFSRDTGTTPYQTNYLHMVSASGYLVQLGERERLADLTEQKIDKFVMDNAILFDKQLADPTKWADFTAAALMNCISEAEAHNIPIREKREAEHQAERERQRESDKRLAAEKLSILNARVDEIAKAIETGEKIHVAYDAGAHSGKNPVLELFKLYGVDIPLRTQGWVNNRLAAINGDSYSFYTKNGGKASQAFMNCLHKLIAAVKQTPIEQKRGILAEKHPIENAEVKKTLEHELYSKFTAMFPEFMNGDYETLRLEAEYSKPLELEWVFGDTISIAHTYERDSEPAFEPLVMLKVNNSEKTMTAVMLEISDPPRKDIVDNDGRFDAAMQKNINSFTAQWLDRAAKQRFRPVEATIDVDERGNVSKAGLVTDKTVKITFDAFGKPIVPESEPVIQSIAHEHERESPVPSRLFPDQTVTPAERDAYGYTAPDMHPLNRDKALALFDEEQPVYLLYPDNTEVMALDRDEIIAFTTDGGLCGISHADWQLSGEFKEGAIVAGFHEGTLESDLLFGGENKFGIYQIPDYIDFYRDFRFAPMRELEALALSVERNNYKLVYTAPLDIHDRLSNLNRIFERFQHGNPECPPDFTERSVSVSDVIVLQWRGEVSAHFVDSFGFKELPSFTGNEHELAPKQTLLQSETRTRPKNMERKTPAKQEPQTLLGELAETKESIAKGTQPNAHKPNDREV